MIYHQLTYIVAALLISGILLLTVDTKIYAVSAMPREKKISHLLGWVQIILFLLVVVVQLIFL